MKLSMVPSVLLLGAAAAPAAAEEPLVFGRSMHSRTSPVDGVRRYGEGPARSLRQRRWAKVSKSSVTSVMSPYKMMHKAAANGSGTVESKASKSKSSKSKSSKSKSSKSKASKSKSSKSETSENSALSPDEAGFKTFAHPVDFNGFTKLALLGDEPADAKSAPSADANASKKAASRGEESKKSAAPAASKASKSASSPDESAESKKSAASADSKASEKSASSPDESAESKKSGASANSKASKKAASRGEESKKSGASAASKAFKSASSPDESAESKKSGASADSKVSKTASSLDESAESKKSGASADSKASKKATSRGEESNKSAASAASKASKSASSPDESAENKKSGASADFKASKKSTSSPDESAESNKSAMDSKATKKSSSAVNTKRSRSRRPKTSKDFGSEDSLGKGFFTDFSSLYDSLDFSMSTSMSFGFDDDFMSFSLDYGTPFMAVSTTSHPGDAIAIPDDDSFAPKPESLMDFGWVAFEYLRQCSGISGADLEYGCLVAETLNAFMGTGATDDDLFSRLRHLRTSQTADRRLRIHQAKSDGSRFLQASDNECYSREATEQTLRPLMNTARDQCLSEGSTVSNEEFEDILGLLLQMLSDTDCERALCSESSNPLVALVDIILSQAAECTGVNLEMEQCAMDHILLLMTSIGSAPQDFELCNRPSENDYALVVGFMAIDAAAKCAETGVRMTDEAWQKVQADLVKIFTDDQCWGISDCDDAPDTTSRDSLTEVSIDFPAPVIDDEEEFGSILSDDGQVCILEPNVDTNPDLERDLELLFFYQVQTVSEDESLLEASLANIEGALIYLGCGVTDDGVRARRLEDFPLDTVPVALYSAPEDLVSSDHPCSPENPQAAACNTIEGKMTLTVVGDTAEYDEDIKLGFYSVADEVFASLPTVLDDVFGDSNVVDVRYIGQDPPPVAVSAPEALVDLTPEPPVADEAPEKLPAADGSAEEPKDAPQDASTISSSNNNSEQESTFQAIAIGASGAVLAAIILAAGYRRLQKQDELEACEDTKLDEKSHGSNDGQSTAYRTADLTYAASTASMSMTSASSCDRSDASSLPSPAHSLGGPLSPEAHRTSPAKFVVLAEEEEENWRDLSILPKLAHDDGTLEDVSEEGEFINSCPSSESGSSSSESLGQISV